MRNINCKWNDREVWCKNENIKCSLFGIGARCCVEYGENVTGIMCLLKEPMPKPKYEELCFKCGCSINQFGIILFSPPKDNIVTKYHLCNRCFKNIIVCKKSIGMFQM